MLTIETPMPPPPTKSTKPLGGPAPAHREYLDVTTRTALSIGILDSPRRRDAESRSIFNTSHAFYRGPLI